MSADEIQAALAWQVDPDNRAALDKLRRSGTRGRQHRVARASETIRRATRRSARWQVAGAAAGVVASPPVRHFSVLRQLDRIRVHEYATLSRPDQPHRVARWIESRARRRDFDPCSILSGLRHVEMSPGEAMFHRRRIPNRPFIVEMPNGSARVLGTPSMCTAAPTRPPSPCSKETCECLRRNGTGERPRSCARAGNFHLRQTERWVDFAMWHPAKSAAGRAVDWCLPNALCVPSSRT